MKRTRVMCAIGLSAALLAGCAGQQSRVEYIGAQKARELALEASGLTASEVTFSETDLSSRNDKDYYLVSFTAEGADYQYDVDALTGIVIESRLPSDTSRVTDDTKQGGTGDSNEKLITEGKSKVIDDTNQDSAGRSDEKLITEEKAVEKALAHAGLSSSQVTVVRNELEYEGRRQIYEVEFYTEDYGEYDYEIDAVTGEVASFDYDAENIAPTDVTDAGMMNEDEAKKLALERVPGAGLRDIWEFETDHDDNHIEYEGKILYGGMEYEFEIDAYSGTFRSWGAEPAD